MGKKVNVNVDMEDGNLRLTISEEVKSRIPRPGDSLYIIQPFVADDNDEDEDGKVVKDAIMAYSYADKMVKASVLTDDLDAVIVNGDYKIPLNEDMTLQTGKLMIFTKEEDAVKKFNSLMSASIKETKRRLELYNNTLNYLEEQVEKAHH